MPPPHVLHVGVPDALAEPANELHVVHMLITEVAGVVVEAEELLSRNIPDCVQRPLGRSDIERNLSRMDFQAELDTLALQAARIGLNLLRSQRSLP